MVRWQKNQNLGKDRTHALRVAVQRIAPYVSVESVRLVAEGLGYYSRSGHTKDFKISIHSFRARRWAQAEVRRVLCMCCSSCMYVPLQRSIIRN